MARPFVVDRAGRSGAAAAVLHPDAPLPVTWRVVSTWSYRRQVGAWLEYTGPYRKASDPPICQVLYRPTAKHSMRAADVGWSLSRAARRMCCMPWDLTWFHVDVPEEVRPTGSWRHDSDDQGARSAHYGFTFDDLTLRRQDHEAWEASRKGALSLLPQKPANMAAAAKQQLDKIDELDLSMRAYNALKRNGITTVDELLGLSNDEILRMRNMGSGSLAEIDAKLAAHGLKRAPVPGQARPATTAATTVSQRPIGAPPEPGVDRARWIGDEVTAMLPHTVVHLTPIAKRRIAARRVLALVAGYEASSPNNDAGTLVGSLSLHLAGLNAYADRVFNGEEPDNAVL